MTEVQLAADTLEQERLDEATRGSDERFLVLLRHAMLEEESLEDLDDTSLTAEGHARMKQIARGLARAMPRVHAIYSSPLLRATQTALWVARAYRSRVEVKNSELLEPSVGPAELVEFLASIPERRAVVVGHEPVLTSALRSLLHVEGVASLELKKGGCYGIRFDERGLAALEWVLSPRILLKLGE